MEGDITHLLVICLEATCDSGQVPDCSTFAREIVEFALLVVEAGTLETVREFHKYVRPVQHTRLKEFSISLTGIQQETVDAAQPFPQVWEQVSAFLQELRTIINPYNPLVVTCGDWDLRTMYINQIAMSRITTLVPEFQRWCNIEYLFERAYHVKTLGLADVLRRLSLPLVGRPHSAIDNARNVAAIVRTIKRDGHRIQVTGSLNETNDGPSQSPPNSATTGSSQPSTPRHKQQNPPKSQLKKKEGPPPPNYGEVIDIGCNLTNKAFHKLLPDTLYRAFNTGVSHIILTGTSVKASRDAIEMVRKWKGSEGIPTLACTVGVHPHDSGRAIQDGGCVAELRDLIQENRDIVVAVGECGLDFDRMFSTVEEQETLFIHQLKLAQEFTLPLFLHTRGAHSRFLQLLATEYTQRPCRGVVHCYTDEDVDRMKSYVELGLYIGFTGWICDLRPGRGGNMQEIVKRVPSDRYMVETDAPFLMPRNKPGRNGSGTCEPHDIVYVVERVAEWRNMDPHQIARESTTNAKTLFF
ncbi:hypothetical protein SeMB42_g06416 [Synchytrium endobioticum]|uniref:Exonuclease domain-containing protein n=1 Tax=Synchytrium endobioticum TaxID=286115 RepID=A0A507CLP7_9FUNG|nr:hypothetical protein SeMB42_g06416 [Synchytrium endobioticum]TPX39582.1 hypothetical protein SeLEV6574_g07111 [Synchytrium endobioticum]